MREIKFRAWSGGAMRYFSLTTLLSGYGSDCPFTPEGEDPLMQYTGLKDKNGMEIYDGDILKFDRIPRMVVIVEWKEHRQHVVHGHGDSGDERFIGYHPSEYFCDWESMEVIGNIYENPNLQKATI